IIESLWQSPGSFGVPTSIALAYKIQRGTGTPNTTTATFTTSGHSAGDTYVLAVQNSASIVSGIYSWNVTLTATYSTNSEVVRTVSGKDGYIDLSNSPFGPGWSMAGLSRLFIDSGSGDVVIEDGSGGVRYFPSAGGGTFTSPGNDFGTLTSSGGNYD